MSAPSPDPSPDPAASASDLPLMPWEAELATPRRIATDLLLLGLDPLSHRVRRPAKLAIGLRAALFAELALAGSIGDDGRAPTVSGPPPDDRILAAVHRTVERRPGVAWKRWFRHVDVDRAALADELLTVGRWQPGGRGAAMIDTAPDAAIALGLRSAAVGRGDQAPTDVRDTVLGALVIMTGVVDGRPQPRAVRDLERRLSVFAEIGPTDRRAALTAMATAQRLLSGNLVRRTSGRLQDRRQLPPV